MPLKTLNCSLKPDSRFPMQSLQVKTIDLLASGASFWSVVWKNTTTRLIPFQSADSLSHELLVQKQVRRPFSFLNRAQTFPSNRLKIMLPCNWRFGLVVWACEQLFFVEKNILTTKSPIQTTNQGEAEKKREPPTNKDKPTHRQPPPRRDAV